MTTQHKTLLFVLALAALVLLRSGPAAQAQQPISGTPFICSADNIGATLTLIPGCLAPEPPLRRYITDVVAQSTTSTAGQMILRVGTSVRSGGSANCGTATTTILPASAGTSVRLAIPANTAAALVINSTSPIAVVPPESDLCVLGIATQTTSIQIAGVIAY